MAQITAIKVPFVKASVTKCLCPKCPVQRKSQCVSGKLATIKEALKDNPLKKENIPGVYCSTGNATCGDIDTKQSCVCGDCAVFDQYKLASFSPIGYYCRDGSAR